jgi:hypothetical protein
MGNERRTILALVAAGRISAADAERLVRAWNEPAQWLLAAIVCLAIGLAHPHLQAHPVQAFAPAAHWLHGLAQHALDAVNTAARLLMQRKEGTV